MPTVDLVGIGETVGLDACPTVDAHDVAKGVMQSWAHSELRCMGHALMENRNGLVVDRRQRELRHLAAKAQTH